MGITAQGLDFLLAARHEGVAFDRTLTIGRQFLLVPPDRLAEMLAPLSAEDLLAPPEEPSFAEALLRRLGADEVCSIDGSDYEGATFVHDLNRPLPSSFDRRFTVVLDGGCLEHIFDFATAIRNCMQLVEVGGHLLCMAPVSNAAGHGFYQFSPELYYRVLSPENGFVVERMLLAEVRPDATWYRVVDPAVAGRRIEFTTRHPAYLYVQARRVDDRPPLRSPPVQSDYDQRWKQDQSESTVQSPPHPQGAVARLGASLKEAGRRHPSIIVPVRLTRRALAWQHRRRHPYDPTLFAPLGRRLSGSEGGRTPWR